MKLSIIIPVFNEEKTIGQVINKLLNTHFRDIEAEIIVVSDGSTDQTENKVEEIIKKKRLPDSRLMFLKYNKNQGKGAAIRTGIKSAHGEYVLIQDADLEYDPKYIPCLLAPIKEKKADAVFGTRLNRLPNIFKEESSARFFLHYIGNRFLSLITSILYRTWITDMETGYKVIPKKEFDAIVIKSGSFDFEPEITSKLLKRGVKIIEIPITTIPRNYSQGKKLRTIHDGIRALYALLKYRFSD